MNLNVFQADGQEKDLAIEKLVEQSTPHASFFLFVFLSTAMATLGIIISSVPVIIGSMLIAPVLYPILAIGMGLSISDKKLMKRSFYTFLQAIVVALASSLLISLFFIKRETIELLSIVVRTDAALIDVGIAIVAGVAATFAMVKKNLNEALPGVAISAALVPPLAVIGIAIIALDWELIRQTVVTFIVSSAGIVLTSLFVFAMFNFYGKKTVVNKAIK
ncbi:MAG: DUF389 domain-containing protein, partial [Candidatus Pacebacteria bacterium]|nr:DUF389 domain-containing protein [Candidatus Paceibacterota bacterium]